MDFPQKPPEMGANFNEIAPSNASVVFRLLMQMQTNAKRKSGTFWLETFYDATIWVYFSVVALLANDAYWFSSRHFIRQHLYDIAHWNRHDEDSWEFYHLQKSKRPKLRVEIIATIHKHIVSTARKY